MLDESPTLSEIARDLHAVASDVRQIKRHVVGDSDPEEALLYRMSRAERDVAELKAAKSGVFKLAWAALLAAASAAGLWAWDRLTGGLKP